MESLTRREQQVLQLIVSGCSTKRVAAELGVSFKTAVTHRYHLMDKVGASNAADLVRRTLTRPELMGSTPPRSSALDKLHDRVIASCADLLESRLLLRAEIAKSREVRLACRENAEQVRFLGHTVRRQAGQLAKLLARKPDGLKAAAAA
jgi:DNA-binding CsgD family transcriptional regulator